MKAYIAFTKKEFIEMIRTYKLLIMGAVFLLMGMMNPITAKFMPEILKSAMPEGMMITIPEPKAVDSWAQFFANIPKMGLVVTVIIFSGIMANEFSRGTLINMLTKGLSRKTVILSKFTMISLVWSAAYLLCVLVTYAYTEYFWSGEIVVNLLFSVFCMWIFGELLLAVIMLGSVVLKSSYGCLLCAGLFVVVLFLINMIPQLQEYNPIALTSSNMALLTEDMTVSEFVIPLGIAGGMIVVFVLAAIMVFRKKQI